MNIRPKTEQIRHSKNSIYRVGIAALGFLIAGVSLSCTPQQKKTTHTLPLHPDVSTLVDATYDKMSWPQRVSQLFGVRPADFYDEEGQFTTAIMDTLFPHGVGHLCQFACMQSLSPDSLRTFVNNVQKYQLTRHPNSAPILVHEEAITGFATKDATVFPQQLTCAASWNPSLIHQKSVHTREAMISCGARLALSPMLDVIRTPHFNRVEESYGEDSYLVSSMALAFVTGLQSDDLRDGVASCTKHFLGYGGGSKSPQNILYQDILMPHEVAIHKGGSQVVMTGYHNFDNVPAVWNKYLMEDVLRGYLDYKGLLVSDYGAVSRKWSGHSKAQFKERAIRALEAGNDIEFSIGISYPLLLEAMENNEVDSTLVQQAVKRVLTLKARLGLLDKTNKEWLADIAQHKPSGINLDPAEARNTAYEIAAQATVMLTNNGILPLDKSTIGLDSADKAQHIALVGPNANTFWCMLGDYTYQSMYSFWQGGQVDDMHPRIVSLMDGLKQSLPSQMTMTYARGCDWNESNEATLDKETKGDPRVARLQQMLIASNDPTHWDEAIRMAKKQDVIIAAMGENPTLCGEGRSRIGIKLPGRQEAFVRELTETGKPVILVIFGGRAMPLGDLDKKCAAILFCGYPGEEGGQAVADLLIGKRNPSGHLPISYPASTSRKHFYYGMGEQALESLVAYPFGHGLSYSTFELQACADATPQHQPIVQTLSLDEADGLTVRCMVQNTSQVAGDDVIQIYLEPADKTTQKYLIPKRLVGFVRTNLAAHQKKEITFSIPQELLASYANGQWHLVPGHYTLSIGHSATNSALTYPIELTGEAEIFARRSIYFSQARYVAYTDTGLPFTKAPY